ncbi:MAG TPA: hypothetical protein VGB09_12380, partial [Candidatus Binatia bacterium]
MFPRAAFKNLKGRSMAQVGETTGMLSGEDERIEIPFEAHQAQGAKGVLYIFPTTFFKTVDRGHGIRRRAESDV